MNLGSPVLTVRAYPSAAAALLVIAAWALIHFQRPELQFHVVNLADPNTFRGAVYIQNIGAQPILLVNGHTAETLKPGECLGVYGFRGVYLFRPCKIKAIRPRGWIAVGALASRDGWNWGRLL